MAEINADGVWPEGVFVRVMIKCDSNVVHPCWGVMGNLNGFIPVWCEPDARRSLGDEFYFVGEKTEGLVNEEIDTITEADETNTPPEAWAALAYYRMTGKIMPELYEPDLTKAPTNEEHT